MTTSATQATITVPVGPAGRAMAEPMSGELLDLMQAHLNLERQSAADYFAAAIWFAERELSGFAEHLRDEAKQEQEHAANEQRLVIEIEQAKANVEKTKAEAMDIRRPDPAPAAKKAKK